jgi:hypothetical protein
VILTLFPEKQDKKGESRRIRKQGWKKAGRATLGTRNKGRRDG